MNKLVIVGNGFDLAHGLPTSYKDFIDDFWKNLKTNYKEQNIAELLFVNESYYRIFEIGEIENFDDFVKNLERYAHEYTKIQFDPDKFTLQATEKNTKFESVKTEVFKFESSFFERLNRQSLIHNWVDIENEYYQELKKISKQKPFVVQGMKIITDEKQKNKNKDAIKKLNREFDQIKRLFETYLNIEVKAKIKSLEFPNISSRFFDYFDMSFVKVENFKEKIKFNDYLLEFSKEDHSYIMNYQTYFSQYQTDIGGGKRALEDISLLKYESFFLNFNYTNTVSYYNSLLNRELFYCESKEIKIHGELNNIDNEINFGFGDEMDDDYKSLENLNDNEYLKNFKSFKYSQNLNYKKLLDFIDSNKFQIYVMGHSCGLSDRTLLNTIFEHENCRSIKIFYHKKKDGSDNFTEIVQNISRHFKDKKMMRQKLVNKLLCEPLPQNIDHLEN